jgi:hypothetical protein
VPKRRSSRRGPVPPVEKSAQSIPTPDLRTPERGDRSGGEPVDTGRAPDADTHGCSALVTNTQAFDEQARHELWALLPLHAAEGQTRDQSAAARMSVAAANQLTRGGDSFEVDGRRAFEA